MTATLPSTDLASIAPAVARVRVGFEDDVTRPRAWRAGQLEAMARLLGECETELLEALAADLGKPEIEAWTTDIGFVLADIRLTLRRLEGWMKPRRVRTPLNNLPARSRVVAEPLGVVLVIAPWNYPVQLLLSPMVAALAAGNAVVAKPSEIAPRVSAVLGRLIPRYLDPRAVAVVEGGVAETTALLEQRFDHIFYTGNGRVARVVMDAAARNLTPVTLELGGKSPTIVAADAKLRTAARRVAWGKFLNAGQTCVAPDYVLVERPAQDRFLEELTAAVRSFYGTDPRVSPDYGRIVNEVHFHRLEKLLDSGTVVFGGVTDEAARYVAPTVLRDVAPDAPVMDEEIFGPILPVIAVDSVEEATAFVREREKPLALYVFSEDPATCARVVETTSSGGVCVNGTVLHLANPDLPFGGVGPSGMGAYHGEAGFRALSHHKSVLVKSTRLDPPVMYPPYPRWKQRLFRRLL